MKVYHEVHSNEIVLLHNLSSQNITSSAEYLIEI